MYLVEQATLGVIEAPIISGRKRNSRALLTFSGINVNELKVTSHCKLQCLIIQSRQSSQDFHCVQKHNSNITGTYATFGLLCICACVSPAHVQDFPFRRSESGVSPPLLNWLYIPVGKAMLLKGIRDSHAVGLACCQSQIH